MATGYDTCMNLAEQILIPPPIQPDGLNAPVEVTDVQLPSCADYRTPMMRVRKLRRKLDPVALLIGYATSAAVGLSLGWWILQLL